MFLRPHARRRRNEVRLIRVSKNPLVASERILLLKSVSIFTEIPQPFLEEIAQFLEDIIYEPGETIFEKGDPGTSLYIIAEGRVCVRDGERILNCLGDLEVFGEMAALDPQPRSASVVAINRTRLFRLDREPLFRLMADHIEVSQEIIHILSQRLRARMRDMAEDFQYMQQFERVIAAAVAVEAGIYKAESLDEVADRTDKLGQLARVFQKMAHEVHLREQRLEQEVAELRIVIDEANQARQVSEITETEYFQNLRIKAEKLRAKHHNQTNQLPSKHG
jgi:CRP/FNR family cyclic AMP-dependent transcriptional regulator